MMSVTMALTRTTIFPIPMTTGQRGASQHADRAHRRRGVRVSRVGKRSAACGTGARHSRSEHGAAALARPKLRSLYGGEANPMMAPKPSAAQWPHACSGVSDVASSIEVAIIAIM